MVFSSLVTFAHRDDTHTHTHTLIYIYLEHDSICNDEQIISLFDICQNK